MTIADSVSSFLSGALTPEWRDLPISDTYPLHRFVESSLAAMSPETRQQLMRQLLAAPVITPPAQNEPIDVYSVEVGRSLVPSLDLPDLLMGPVNHEFAQLGIRRAPVRFRDNLLLRPHDFTILCRNRPITQARLEPDRWLALGPADVVGQLEGKDATNLTGQGPAKWISEEQIPQAETCQLLDPTQVLAQVMAFHFRQHAAESLGLDDVHLLLQRLADRHPRVVELARQQFSLWQLRKLLLRLLAQNVSLRPLDRILEAMLGDPADPLRAARRVLAPNMVDPYLDGEGQLSVTELDPELENRLLPQCQPDHTLRPDARTARELYQALPAPAGQPLVVCCAGDLREGLALYTARARPQLVWLAWDELPAGQPLIRLGPLGGPA